MSWEALWECSTTSRRPWAEFQSFWKMSVSRGWWTRYEDTKSPRWSPARPCPWAAFLERLDEFTQKKGWAISGKILRFQKWGTERSGACFLLILPVVLTAQDNIVWPWYHLTQIDTPRLDAVKQILGYDGVGEGYAVWGPHECGVSNVFQ